MSDFDLLLIFLSLFLFSSAIFVFWRYLRLRGKLEELEAQKGLYEETLYLMPLELLILKGEEISFMSKRALENLGGYPKISDLKRAFNRRGRKFELIEIFLSKEQRLILLFDVTERESFKEAYQVALSYLSHELKTPFAVASGYLERLEEALKREKVSEESFSLYRKTQEAFQRLEKLLKKLFSGIDYLAKDIRIKRESVKLKELIDEALFWVSPLAEEKGVTFEFHIEEEVTLLGSSDLLIQAFFNVLENAVKASPPGEKVLVRGFSSGANQVVLTIRDKGPGVEPEKLSLLGMPFFKLRESEGMGLGLFITKRIIESHGGELKFTLPSVGGLEVQIYLPKESSVKL